MKRIFYSVIALFVSILIITFFIAQHHPVHTVKYDHGRVVDSHE